MNECRIEGCTKPVKIKSRGWCQMHYFRWRRQGEPGEAAPRFRVGCMVGGCERPHGALGYCDMHVQRVRKWGDARSVTPHRAGSDHPRWVDGEVGYCGAHDRVRALKGRASDHLCQCGRAAEEWAYDHGDPHEQHYAMPNSRNSRTYVIPFSPDPKRYTAMCRRCHRRADRAHKAAQRGAA